MVFGHGKPPPRGRAFVLLVEGVGFEPTNSEAERIYSPRPLATWIPFRPVGRVYLAVSRPYDKRFPVFSAAFSGNRKNDPKGLHSPTFWANLLRDVAPLATNRFI